MPDVPWRFARAARRKSARFEMTVRQTETAGGKSPAALLPALGASGGVMPFGSAGALGAQRLAATSAASIHNLAASFGRHACAEPMAPLAHEVRRLIGAFHRSVSNVRFRARGFGLGCVFEARPLKGELA